MKSKCFARNNSGQALIITSLIIAMLVISTAYYVLEINTAPMDQAPLNSTFLMTRPSVVNTLINSLANITNGGNSEVLEGNLRELTQAVQNSSYGGQCEFVITPLNSTPYQNGLFISWGDNGSGISSVYTSVALNFSDPNEMYSSEYEVNVTTAITAAGFCTANGTQESVSLICQLYNENDAALANNFTIFYQEPGGNWTPADSTTALNINDYGNGTYWISFDALAQGALQVSVGAHDLRNIFVMANTTCLEN
jgi:hypothetical protein